jgi:hypothetical protein
MDNNIKTLMVAGVVAAAFLAPTLGATIPELVQFSPGDPVGAAAFNSNFGMLRSAVQDLEEQVATLETELAQARSTAGQIGLSNGETITVRRKLLTGTKSSTSTTLPHGLPNNPASQRRILGCEIVGDATGIQAVNLAGQLGAQSATWCEFTDTEVEITWATAGPLTFHVIIDYTDAPFR